MRGVTGTALSLIPDYSGGSLSNLMAELEVRLAGTSLNPGLYEPLADQIPQAATYVLVLIDGLGARQLDHPAAGPLAFSQRATIDAPFPTTTTVSLATVATALPPSQHGLIGHFLLLHGHPRPVNGLRWVDTAGQAVPSYAPGVLPAPNLWERLGRAGVESITVQPAGFEGTPLTRALYRGCRFEAVTTTREWFRATLDLAMVPGRLVFAYHPAVDIAAHMHGPQSPEYARALADVANAWERMADRLPGHATMIGTADHGVVPIPKSGKHLLHSYQTRGLTLFGDPRSLYVKGPRSLIEELGTHLPGEWHPHSVLRKLWGPEPTHGNRRTALPVLQPDGAWLAHEGMALLPGHMDRRLVGYHGGLDPRELEIPLLVASR